MQDTFQIKSRVAGSNTIVVFEIQVYFFFQALKEKIVFVVESDLLQNRKEMVIYTVTQQQANRYTSLSILDVPITVMSMYLTVKEPWGHYKWLVRLMRCVS